MEFKAKYQDIAVLMDTLHKGNLENIQGGDLGQMHQAIDGAVDFSQLSFPPTPGGGLRLYIYDGFTTDPYYRLMIPATGRVDLIDR